MTSTVNISGNDNRVHLNNDAGASITGGIGYNNKLSAGNGAGDTIAVTGGDHNTLRLGNGAGDRITIGALNASTNGLADFASQSGPRIPLGSDPGVYTANQLSAQTINLNQLGPNGSAEFSVRIAANANAADWTASGGQGDVIIAGFTNAGSGTAEPAIVFQNNTDGLGYYWNDDSGKTASYNDFYSPSAAHPGGGGNSGFGLAGGSDALFDVKITSLGTYTLTLTSYDNNGNVLNSQSQTGTFDTSDPLLKPFIYTVPGNDTGENGAHDGIVHTGGFNPNANWQYTVTGPTLTLNPDGTAPGNGHGSDNRLNAGNGDNDILTIGRGNDNRLTVGKGNFDHVAIGSGNDNRLIAGDGSTDFVAVTGAGNYNYLQAGNGDSAEVSVGSGNHNSLIAKEGANDRVTIGSGNDNILRAGNGDVDQIEMESGNGNRLKVGNGANDLVEIRLRGNSNTLQAGNGDTAYVTMGYGNDNTLIAGDGVGDIVSLLGGNHNRLSAGKGDFDQVTNSSGNDNHLSAGDGNYDLVRLVGNGDHNLLKAGNGDNAAVVLGGGNHNVLLAGDGANDAVTVDNKGNHNYLRAGNGTGDTVSINGGNDNTLVAGNGDNTTLIDLGHGSDNRFILGYGIGDTAITGDGGRSIVHGGNGGDAISLNGKGDIGIGGSGADTITAYTKYDTLTGGLGADTLNGSIYGFDVFKDTAAGLNGDTVNTFLSSDKIDITDLHYSKKGTALNFAAGILTVADAFKSIAINLDPSLNAAGFSTASDGHGGTLVTYNPNDTNSIADAARLQLFNQALASDVLGSGKITITTSRSNSSDTIWSSSTILAAHV